MGKQTNSWKYCDITTTQHCVAKKFKGYIEKMNKNSMAEGAKRASFKNNQSCINLDKVEGNLSKNQRRNARKTMDICFGVSSKKVTRMVLCEYRLRYKNVRNLKRKELDQKISNSKNLIGHSPNILNKYIFVFSSEIKNQAYSYIRRLYSNKNITEVLDVKELKNKYF